MKLSLWELDRKQKTERLAAYVLGGIVLFNAVLGTVLWHFFNSDITVKETILPQLWDIVLYFTAFVFYWAAFAFLLHCASRYSLKGCKRTYIIYGACVIARYLLSLLIGCLMLAELPDLYDLWEFLIVVVVDAIQIALASLLIYLFSERNQKNRIALDVQKGIFCLSDRFLRCALLISLIPSTLKLLSRIFYDISFGLPQSTADLLGMISWYLIDLICVWLGYLLIYWLQTKLTIWDKEAELQRNQQNTEQ